MSPTNLTPAQFLLGVAVAALLAMAIFAHASRHGSKRATAWGVATFLAAGVVVPVYFIRYYLTRRP